MPTGKPTKMKPCAICGEMFLPKSPSSKICSKDHYVNCEICGKPFVWNSTQTPKPCSRTCRRELTKRNNLIKYGVEHPMQSKEVQENHKAAMMEKYGVESPLQSEEIKEKVKSTNLKKFGSEWALGSDEIKEKSKQTMLERYGGETTLQSDVLRNKQEDTMIKRYGVDNPAKSEEITERRRNTLIDRYGTDNPMKYEEFKKQMIETRKLHIDEIHHKMVKTMLERYGVENPMDIPSVREKMKSSYVSKYSVDNPLKSDIVKAKVQETNLDRYDVPWFYMTKKCREASKFHISKHNKSFKHKLEEIGVNSEFEKRIENRSYDLIIPDQNVLIEIDPTYTHNSFGNHWDENGLDKYYHRDKTALAEKHGYRCIHVFDWDDIDKIVESLQPKTTLYARKCKIFKIKNEVCDEFLKKYHFQGTCRGQLLCLGLVYCDELVEVMTFGKPRYSKKHDVELLRLCTKPEYRVVGGASKLFKFATEYYGLHNIISYCDRSKFSGQVYEQLGMSLIRKTPPQEVWCDGKNKITANLLRQRGFDQLFHTNYGKGTNNNQLMLEHGWLPIYDCGQLVYEL
jgi:hypothetical protein|nr:MAG TPA: endonuclease-like protein [Bacteriophage sp.]